jgi:hypothetical protein
MSVDGSDLGGRLPLYDSEALDPIQKELYDWLMDVAVPWAEAARFRASIEGGRLIGPFNPALLTPGISSAFMDLAVAEQRHTSLSKRSREVVILTVGAVWQAPYELYAHCAVRPPGGPLRRRGANSVRRRAAEESHRCRDGSPPGRPRAIDRTSSRRGALPRGRSAPRGRRDHGNRHTHWHLSYRVRNPQRV